MTLPVSLPVNTAAPAPLAAGGEAQAIDAGATSPFDVILQQMAVEGEAVTQPQALAAAPVAATPDAEQAVIEAIAALATQAGAEAVAAEDIKTEETADPAANTSVDAETVPEAQPDSNAAAVMALAVPLPAVPPVQTPVSIDSVEASGAQTPEAILPDARAAQPQAPSSDLAPVKGEGAAADFAGLMGDMTGDLSNGSGDDAGADTGDSQAAAPSATTPGDTKKTGHDAALATLDKTRPALDTAPAPVNASAPQATETASPASVDAPASTASQAFSLQTVSDTPGSYTATGTSAAAGSNLSKAAVESLSALSMQISKKLDQGNTKFAIELYPADLGKVEVSLHIARDGRTTAHLTFDSPVTAASFSASETELRQQLANAGLNVDKDALSFSSRDGSGGGFGSALNQQQQQQSQAQAAARAMNAARRAADEADLDAALTQAASQLRNRPASTLALNLIV